MNLPRCALPGSDIYRLHGVYYLAVYILPPQVCITWYSIQWKIPPSRCVLYGIVFSDISCLHSVYYLAVYILPPQVCITWQCISCLHRCALPGSDISRLHGVYYLAVYILPPQVCITWQWHLPPPQVCITWQWHLPPPWCALPGSDISCLHGVYFLAVTSPSSTVCITWQWHLPPQQVCITWQCIFCLHRCIFPGSDISRLHSVYYLAVTSPASTVCITWQCISCLHRCALPGSDISCLHNGKALQQRVHLMLEIFLSPKLILTNRHSFMGRHPTSTRYTTYCRNQWYTATVPWFTWHRMQWYLLSQHGVLTCIVFSGTPYLRTVY